MKKGESVKEERSLSTIAKNIDFMLQQFNLQKKELAEAARCSQTTLSNISTKGYIPSRDSSYLGLADGFSQLTGLPLKLFDQGKALKEDDFPEKVRQYLENHRNDGTQDATFSITSHKRTRGVMSGQEDPRKNTTDSEQKILDFIRDEFGGAPSNEQAEQLIYFLTIIGIESEFIKSIIAFYERGLLKGINLHDIRNQSRAVRKANKKT